LLILSIALGERRGACAALLNVRAVHGCCDLKLLPAHISANCALSRETETASVIAG